MKRTTSPCRPTGQQISAALWVHYGGVEGDGSLVEAMRDSDRSHAIDWSVLDRGVRHFGSVRFGSVSGECPGDEESAGALMVSL
jgi:hypothetical protein